MMLSHLTFFMSILMLHFNVETTFGYLKRIASVGRFAAIAHVIPAWRLVLITTCTMFVFDCIELLTFATSNYNTHLPPRLFSNGSESSFIYAYLREFCAINYVTYSVTSFRS
jgi:hypothetical protein